MKSSRNISAPRLVCRVARQWYVVTGAQTTRHTAQCPDCQEYFRAGEALEAELRREASLSARAAVTPSTGFEHRLIQAVRDAAAPAPRRMSEWSPGRLFSGLATAGAAAALALVFINTAKKPSPNDPAQAAMPAEAEVLVKAVDSLSDQLVTTVIPSAGEIVARNPLQQELGFVYADARSALDFLAMNFLPRSTARAETNSVTERNRSSVL